MRQIDERQLKLFAEELDVLRKAAEESARAFSRFTLAGRVKKIEDLRKTQRRYRWHKQLKARGITVDGPSRTIDVSNHESFLDIPVPERWYVGQLIRRGYNATYKLKL